MKNFAAWCKSSHNSDDDQATRKQDKIQDGHVCHAVMPHKEEKRRGKAWIKCIFNNDNYKSIIDV